VTARLWDIGRELQSRVRNFFENPPGPAATPLELLQAALDEVERKVQPGGRGVRLFPYTRIDVRISQPDGDRAATEAVFRQLESRLRERLVELRCEPPPAIGVRVLFGAPADGVPVLAVECVNEAGPHAGPAPGAPYPELRVMVVKGQCAEAEYAFVQAAITIGRTAEPVDAHGRVRRNDVAFLDARDGTTETVGRAHARLEFDRATRAYHLFNEGSSNPTFVVREGRSIRVAPRDPVGVRVHSGDEVQLGRAVIRLTIG
jgi:hypothetical protein